MRALLPALLVLFCAPLLAGEPRNLGWEELVPPDAPPQQPQARVLHDVDALGAPLSEDGPAAVQQQPDAPVVAELDGIRAKLPGYIVPLEVTEDGQVIEFLLVPYFGACIHVPPPPSNQIVHVSSALGVPADALWQPFWVEGRMRVQHSSSELAEAGYRMQAQKIDVYELDE